MARRWWRRPPGSTLARRKWSRATPWRRSISRPPERKSTDRGCCEAATTEGKKRNLRVKSVDKAFSPCASSRCRAVRAGWTSRTQRHHQIGGFINGSEEIQEGSEKTGGQEVPRQEADEESRSQE